MNYQIVYDQPGRLRVRCGQLAFSKEQGYGITSLLCAITGVTEAAACHINGSILVYYQPHLRGTVLSRIKALDNRCLPVASPSPTDRLREIDNGFYHRIMRLVCRRTFFRYFLPRPFRMVNTILRACRYWRQGAASLFRGRLDVAVLDAASIGAAMIQKSYGTANSVMFLLSLSGLLEDYTRSRAKQALAESLTVHVDQVWLLNPETGAEQLIPMAQLKVGDLIRIHIGTMIPIDGTVAAGEAMVNEASITGEPLPVFKKREASVYAGTVVEEGSVVVKVNALAADTRIHKIIDMIDSSEALKAGVQSRAEHLADAIVPFSFLGFVLVGLLTRNLTKALSVLMVDYSCAIKLSAPISIISAMREAANNQIMVKGGKFLEAFAQADTIVFDKTGTLTEACPQVGKVVPLADLPELEVLKIAACLEEHFPHSMAKAVVRKAQELDLKHEEEHTAVEYVVAHGIATTLHGQRTLIGSQHFIFEDEKVICTAQQKRKLKKLESQGSSILYLAIGGKLTGAICIDDPPRPEAAQVIQLLRQTGIQQVLMLTGDHQGAADAVSRSLGLDGYYAQILPGDKASIITRLKEGGRQVIMVGDGINDSPALAAADVSVAMKEASDIAREVADITLLSGSLEGLVTLRSLSQRLFNKINHNYHFILTFNTALLLSGLLGIMTPASAALLHNLSTMGVSMASMRRCLPTEKKLEEQLAALTAPLYEEV